MNIKFPTTTPVGPSFSASSKRVGIERSETAFSQSTQHSKMITSNPGAHLRDGLIVAKVGLFGRQRKIQQPLPH
jgi:hypothetical protein